MALQGRAWHDGTTRRGDNHNKGPYHLLYFVVLLSLYMYHGSCLRTVLLLYPPVSEISQTVSLFLFRLKSAEDQRRRELRQL